MEWLPRSQRKRGLRISPSFGVSANAKAGGGPEQDGEAQEKGAFGVWTLRALPGHDKPRSQ